MVGGNSNIGAARVLGEAYGICGYGGPIDREAAEAMRKNGWIE